MSFKYGPKGDKKGHRKCEKSPEPPTHTHIPVCARLEILTPARKDVTFFENKNILSRQESGKASVAAFPPFSLLLGGRAEFIKFLHAKEE